MKKEIKKPVAKKPVKRTATKRVTKPMSKLPKFMKELEKVLADPNTFTLTMKELCVLVNNGLKREERVNYKSFMRWANPNIKGNVDDMTTITPEEAEDFKHLIEYSKVVQKVALTGRMLDTEGGNKWAVAWLLERKFTDLQLNQKLEIGSGGITLNIEAGNSETQESLDLIDIEYEDITDQKKLN